MSSLSSMNTLSDAIDDIHPLTSSSSSKKYHRRGPMNGHRSGGGGDKIDHHHHSNGDHYEEKIITPPTTTITPNPTISFTATSTGTPIIIAAHNPLMIGGGGTNNNRSNNDSPLPSSSTSITPTSSLGSSRGENNHHLHDNNHDHQQNNNNDNNNNNEDIPEKEGVREENDSPTIIDEELIDGDTTNTDNNNDDDINNGILKRPSQYDNSRNLHVDNLPPITEVEFRSLFLPFGTIARSRIVTDVVTGLPSGYGFVMFEREEDAYRALHSLHNRVLPNTNRPLRVTFKKPKSLKAVQREKEKEKERDELLAHGHTPSLSTLFVNTNLYVAGIPLLWKKKDLDDIFAPFGTILESRILTDRTTGLSKGVGFVRYQQLESCHNATKQLNGKPPNGAPPDSQNLTVRFAVDRTAQALAVAQQTVMATVGGGASGGGGTGTGGSGSGGNNNDGGGRRGNDGGKHHHHSNNNMMSSRSYSSHSSHHHHHNTMGINNTVNNNNTINPPSSGPASLIPATSAHLSPSHYLQLQAMMALQQQQQQIMANRVAVAMRAGGPEQTSISSTAPTYLYPFTQSALSMAAAVGANMNNNPTLMITNTSSPSMNALNPFLNATTSATNTDAAYYSQVFV